MTFDFIAPGIQLVGRFGRLKTGIWLLKYKSECMLLEMPDQSDKDPFRNPWDRIAKYIEQENLHLKFMTATHSHTDHFDTYPNFHNRFPKVPIVVNRLFFHKYNLISFIKPEDLDIIGNINASIEIEGVPIYCFNEKCFETNLEGEQLFLIRAPKHSWSDTMVIFRGCIISGDWWIGPGDPNRNMIPLKTINESIDFLEAFIHKKNYHIHSLFSVHANEFRYGIDFIELMEQTRP